MTNGPSIRTGREPPELPETHQSFIRTDSRGDPVEMKIYDTKNRHAWVEGEPMEARQ